MHLICYFINCQNDINEYSTTIMFEYKTNDKLIYEFKEMM